jgi:hypothetical protein
VLLSLDPPVWAALDALLDECPVIHAAIAVSPGAPTQAVNPSAFEFISENRQVASIRQFMRLLGERL